MHTFAFAHIRPHTHTGKSTRIYTNARTQRGLGMGAETQG